MKFDVKFSESNQSFKPQFGEVHNISDGGYERGYAKGYEVGYTDGVATAEVDSARFASELKFNNWSLFGGETGEVTIYNQTSLSNTFAISRDTPNQTVKHLTVNCDTQPTNMFGAFRAMNDSDTTLNRLTLNFDTSKCSDFGYCFRGLRRLEVIDGTPLDFSSINPSEVNAINYAFYVCNSLKDIRFKPNTIPSSISFGNSGDLTNDSVWSIINGLMDYTGGESKTVTFAGSIKQKLGSAEKEAIASKNWVLG